jgi:hypothetical protein
MQRRELISLALALCCLDPLVAYAGAGCPPVSEVKHSRITASIRVRQTGEGDRLRVLVSFEFRNEGRTQARIEKWKVLDPPVVDSPILELVRQDGSRIRYRGKFGYREPLEDKDYLRLAPGEVRTVRDVDVTDVFDFPKEAQRLSIRYSAFTEANPELQVIESPCVELDYQPVM